MARVELLAEQLVIRLTKSERVLAFRRRDIVLDRAALTSVLITEDPWVWLRGVRAPGTHIPGILAYGTWRGSGIRDFTLIRFGREALVLDFDPAYSEDRGGMIANSSDHADHARPGRPDRFTRVILSTLYASELIRLLRLDDEGDVPPTVG